METSERTAVIYCCASSASLPSPRGCITAQEAACRDHAADEGYQVVTVFADCAVSDATTERPAFEQMIAFLEAAFASAKPVVIVEDIDSLGRGMYIYHKLRAAIEAAGSTLASPNFVPAQTPKERLVEGLLGAAHEYRARLDEESISAVA